MTQDYIKERYDADIVIDWEAYLDSEDLTQISTPKGFITFKFEGDAALIYDMYVKPEYRKHTTSWFLHDLVVERAEQLGKRVMITFSDFMGKNHMLGLKAIKIAGFTPAFKTNDQFVFIKGI